MSLCQHVHIADISRREEEHNVLLDSYGEQGWPRSENNCLPPMCPGFDSICGLRLSLLLVLSSVPRDFFFGFSGFLISSKTNISKFQFDLGMHGLF